MRDGGGLCVSRVNNMSENSGLFPPWLRVRFPLIGPWRARKSRGRSQGGKSEKKQRNILSVWVKKFISTRVSMRVLKVILLMSFYYHNEHKDGHHQSLASLLYLSGYKAHLIISRIYNIYNNFLKKCTHEPHRSVTADTSGSSLNLLRCKCILPPKELMSHHSAVI